MRSLNLMAVLATTLPLLSAMSASAQEEQPTRELGIQININEITCREMFHMGGDERDFTLIYFHGFMSGKNNLIEFDGPELAQANESIINGCIENPDSGLLTVYEDVRG